VDAAGNVTTYKVAQYHSLMSAAARTFAHMREYPVDLCTLFMRGLHPDIKAQFEEFYPNHTQPHDRNGRLQRAALAEILKQASRAEDHVINTQRLISRQMGQTFTADVDSYASQAERTLAIYQKGPASPDQSAPSGDRRGRPKVLGRGHSCHGCGEHHMWSECPNKNKPGVADRARENIAKFKAARSKAGGRAGRFRKREPNLDDFTESGRAKITKQVLEASVSEEAPDEELSTMSSPSNSSGLRSPTAASSPAARGRGGRGRGPYGTNPFIFIVDAVILASPTKPILPVPINTNLPHITLQLAAADEDADAPCLSVTVDTAASITTRNSDFLFKISRNFPGCVAAIYTDKNYSPLTLSGVVQRNGSAVTTELPLAFVFRLPYYTKKNEPALLMIGAGPHVNVNVILGIPFIEASQMIIDFNDRVIECRALDCPPFPIVSKRAQVTPTTAAASIPIIGHDPAKYSEFLRELDGLEAHVASVYATPASPAHSDKKVRFDSSVPPAPAPLVQPSSGPPLLKRDSLDDSNDWGWGTSAGSDTYLE
jgi:hypothetical protein